MDLIGYLVMASIIFIVFIGFLFLWIKIRLSTKRNPVLKVRPPEESEPNQREIDGKSDIEKHYEFGLKNDSLAHSNGGDYLSSNVHNTELSASSLVSRLPVSISVIITMTLKWIPNI